MRVIFNSDFRKPHQWSVNVVQGSNDPFLSRPFCQHLRARWSINGSSGCARSFFLDFARGYLCSVYPGDSHGNATSWQHEASRFLETHLEGFARMDALLGVRLFRLRSGELCTFHFQFSEWRQWNKPSANRLARILWALDGLLLCFIRYVVLGGKLELQGVSMH